MIKMSASTPPAPQSQAEMCTGKTQWGFEPSGILSSFLIEVNIAPTGLFKLNFKF